MKPWAGASFCAVLLGPARLISTALPLTLAERPLTLRNTSCPHQLITPDKQDCHLFAMSSKTHFCGHKPAPVALRLLQPHEVWHRRCPRERGQAVSRPYQTCCVSSPSQAHSKGSQVCMRSVRVQRSPRERSAQDTWRLHF